MNPCSEKSSCTECLKDSACNWCTSHKYFNVDGSPLPRCNSDNFFMSSFCPEEERLNPSHALAEGETCSSCEYCAGGICSENKKVKSFLGKFFCCQNPTLTQLNSRNGLKKKLRNFGHISKLGVPYLLSSLVWIKISLDKHSSVYPTYLTKKFGHY